MLNRRILRIKAFKVLYSYAENPAMDLQEAEGMLELSCQATRDLYLFMLAIIPALTREASNRIEAAKSKFNPTQEELNPNLKFVNNAIAKLLDQDPDFQKLLSKKKISWDQYDALLRSLYDTLRTREYFQNYMNSDKCSIKEDAELFTRMYEEELDDNDALAAILEEISILWIDDLAYALTCCCKTLQTLATKSRWDLPPLYQSDILKASGKDADSDKEFVVKLLRNAFAGYEKYSQIVSESVAKIDDTKYKWDKDRLYTIDMCLIVLGLAEAKTFEQIPIKVTINEYVEISKYYSTPKSRSFINGILDKLIQDMVKEGEVVKSGKGIL